MNEMMREAGQFSTTGTLDEAFLRSHARYMGVGRNVMILIIGYLAVIVLALAGYSMTGSMVNLALLVLGVVLLCWRPRRYYKRWLKLCLERMKETSPEGHEVITVSCTETGVRVENQTSGGAMTIAYENIARAVETDETVFILTNARQMTAFFKSSLTEQECGELRAYLKSKGIKVKK